MISNQELYNHETSELPNGTTLKVDSVRKKYLQVCKFMGNIVDADVGVRVIFS